jgi:hypothetical protein
MYMPEPFERWLKDSVGLPRELLESLGRDDDWTFVVKMHGILEAALNHLLLTQFDNPALAQIVPRLETNNERTGKIAFLKAFDLLPTNARTFIKRFSEVRNIAVHDIRNFDLNLVKYLASLKDRELRKSWEIALTSWMGAEPSEAVREFSLHVPKEAIYNSCMMILIRCYEKHTNTEEQGERIRSATKFFEGRMMFQRLGKPQESSPTE